MRFDFNVIAHVMQVQSNQMHLWKYSPARKELHTNVHVCTRRTNIQKYKYMCVCKYFFLSDLVCGKYIKIHSKNKNGETTTERKCG